MKSYRFGPEYLERVALSDGSEATLRCLRPQDKPLLVAGMKQMSTVSRFHRFFASKRSFTERELRYLTEIDGVDHFALGAGRADERGEPVGEDAGMGVGRFLRTKDEPTVAEPSIAVVDRAQRLGLGRVLFTRLIAAARERDIERFRFEVLAENQGMQRLVADVAPGAECRPCPDDPESLVSIELDLPACVEADADRDSPLYRLFRAAADGKAFHATALERLWRWIGGGDEPSPGPQ